MPNLHTIRVVDFSRLLPGPYCTLLLADMGADVIKVESTLLGDPVRLTPPYFEEQSVPFASVNRNKRSLALSHRKPAGRELLVELLHTADVFVETFKPGQAARQGLDYDSVRAVNESIVYCSLSGYGQTSDYASRSAHDLNFLGLSGVLDLMRDRAGRPVIPAFQFADVAGGSLFAAVAILAALVERAASGQGQYLDVSIWEGTASLAALQMAPKLVDAERARVAQDYLAGDLPGYNVYETRDGGYMTLAALEPVLWSGFCRAIGREDLIAHQFPEERDRAWVIEEVAAIFRSQDRAHWQAVFDGYDLCCEPVLSLDEAAHQAVGKVGGALLGWDDPDRPPWRQLAPPKAVAGREAHLPPPLLGEHTAEILAELGVSRERLNELRAQKVVAIPEDTSTRRLKSL